jgi:CBS domain-containing protein
MDKENIGSVIVEDGNSVCILTERDILRKIVAKGRDTHKTLVRDIMVGPLITIGPEKTVGEADELMTKHKIRRLPVMKSGNMIGIVTVRDVSKGLRYTLGKRVVKSMGSEHFHPSYGKKN